MKSYKEILDTVLNDPTLFATTPHNVQPDLEYHIQYWGNEADGSTTVSGTLRGKEKNPGHVIISEYVKLHEGATNDEAKEIAAEALVRQLLLRGMLTFYPPFSDAFRKQQP